MRNRGKGLWIGIALLGFSSLIAEKPKVEVLSENPRIMIIRNFLNDKECDYLINLSRPKLERSLVIDEQLGNDKIDAARTSYGTYFPLRSGDKIIENIEKRIAKLTKMPQKNGEALQILHYNVGGEFKPHHDYFDPATPGGKENYDRGGQRYLTFIMYLHTTEEGGQTIFPEANVKVTPQKGTALIFYNCTPDGKEDPLTLHGGAPVLKGEKWIATKWYRTGPFN